MHDLESHSSSPNVIHTIANMDIISHILLIIKKHLYYV